MIGWWVIRKHNIQQSAWPQGNRLPVCRQHRHWSTEGYVRHVTQALSDRDLQRKVVTAAEAARERCPQEAGTEMGFESGQEFGETGE